MTTTIKVSNEVRDRLKGQAALAHRTLGQHLEHLADMGERETRMAALRTAIQATPAGDLSSWREETSAWEQIQGMNGPGVLGPGEVIWAAPEIAIGREQASRRRALVVAGAAYLETVDTLALVVPITSVDRGWPNHVEVIGANLEERSWAMSEQVRTISRERVVGRAGRADEATLVAIRGWLADFLEL